MSFMMSNIQRHIERRRKHPSRLGELRQFKGNESGQAMTEFCIILPLLLFLIFGCLQLMMIANAQSFLNLANFYALRAGVVHYERYQYNLQENSDENNLEEKMRESALVVLTPVIPRWDHGIAGDMRELANAALSRSRLHFDLETMPNVRNSIPRNDRNNWLQCRVDHFDYRTTIPFAGGIIANLYWWTQTVPVLYRFKEPMGRNEATGIAIRPYMGGIFSNYPMWPFIRMQTRNYDLVGNRVSTISGSSSRDTLRFHRMAIARRIYRQPGTPQPHNDTY